MELLALPKPCPNGWLEIFPVDKKGGNVRDKGARTDPADPTRERNGLAVTDKSHDPGVGQRAQSDSESKDFSPLLEPSSLLVNLLPTEIASSTTASLGVRERNLGPTNLVRGTGVPRP